jgi:GxxExxY protein
MLHQETTERIITCSIQVHRHLGPGLPEQIYQRALAVELRHCGIEFAQEPRLPVRYRGVKIGHYRPDFIVEDRVVIEIKAANRYEPAYAAQVLTYLRVAALEVGLLLNFTRPTMREGVKRFVLTTADTAAPCRRVSKDG